MNNDNHILNAIIKTINNNQKIKKHFNFSYKTQKYSMEEIFPILIQIIKYALPWRFSRINYSTLYNTYTRLIRFNVFKSTYLELLQLYFKKECNNKLKYCYLDSTSIPNRHGIEFVRYNGHKKKKVTKISIITDSHGVPINSVIASGNIHDSKISLEHFKDNNWLINKKLLNKTTLLADSAYDSSKLTNILDENDIKYLIAKNNRNSHTKEIMTDKEKLIYKKRIKIKHTNNSIKIHRRIACRYDKTVKSLYQSLYLSFIGLILQK